MSTELIFIKLTDNFFYMHIKFIILLWLYHLLLVILFMDFFFFFAQARTFSLKIYHEFEFKCTLQCYKHAFSFLSNLFLDITDINSEVHNTNNMQFKAYYSVSTFLIFKHLIVFNSILF